MDRWSQQAIHIICRVRNFDQEIPGLNNPAELFNLYQFITRKENYDQTAYNLAIALHPITKIAPELQDRSRKLSWRRRDWWANDKKEKIGGAGVRNKMSLGQRTTSSWIPG